MKLISLSFPLLVTILLITFSNVLSAVNPENNPIIPQKISENLSNNNKQARQNDEQISGTLKGEKNDTVKSADPNKPKDLGKTIVLSSDSLSSVLLNNRVSSMMYSDKESQNIDRAIAAMKSKEAFSPEKIDDTLQAPNEEVVQKAIEEVLPEQSYVYLASILYISSNNWTIWLGDRKITSITNNKSSEFYAMSVTKTKVKLKWKLGVTKWNILMGVQAGDQTPKTNEDNEVETIFEIQPNQTFTLKSKKIVEGKSIIESSKKAGEAAAAAQSAIPGSTPGDASKTTPGR